MINRSAAPKNAANELAKQAIKKAIKAKLNLLSLKAKLYIGAALLAVLLLVIMIAGMVSIIQNIAENSETDSSGAGAGIVGYGTAQVSTQVLQYESAIKSELDKYGKGEYTPLLLALIMQESTGAGNDPMQASESKCGYIGCITNPSESIQYGVKHFLDVMAKANNDIKLTLQSYNFGGGFINYVNERGGAYTYELAISFSQMMYQKLAHTGIYKCHRPEAIQHNACYGDIKYVDAVLRYLPATAVGGGGGTVVNASGAVKKAIETGQTALGRPYFWGGGRSNASIARKEFDCSSFVWWAYREAGVNLGPMGATTETLKHLGKRVPASDIQVGDLIFWNTYKVDGHVGIYIGNDQFIGAQSSGGVSIANFRSNSYWGGAKQWKGHVRRVVQ
ncbi:bifunctional lysozyme/C40 family peptidase [Domibacillus sp. A3M-37]|uniref:bifunctional lytic transglycosylase/C40 family peptidase n=1 Tax=Domibacillus sp. A3M-37 TaxID=2962037 RepID=UPI0020B7B2E9|nr:bifunctional lytic transglycosylase/C40 family peptidase [Domibacillus sp. A3M-37]MCP3763736.1 bifunctional lysozyme/C40 family peptidase [Domibacillus sp. A3M-37]